MKLSRWALVSLTLAAAIAAVNALAAGTVHGVWTASATESNGIDLSVRYGHNQIGQNYPVATFNGLSETALHATTDSPVRFEVRGDAGTINLDGSFRNGDGVGHFDFTPSTTFDESVKALGIITKRDTDLSSDRLMQYTLTGLSLGYMREMMSAGYHESLDTYSSMRLFNVTTAIIDELATLGYRNVTAGELISTRIHRVTPDYIRSMQRAGFDHLSLDKLMASRIHKATPEFIQEMKSAGFDKLTMDELIAFRIHKVTPEFVRELRTLGYKDLDRGELVSFRIHGVTPEFIRQLHDAGYELIPAQKLIEMKIHGIDAAYVKQMQSSK